jgi:hypothetical protein
MFCVSTVGIQEFLGSHRVCLNCFNYKAGKSKASLVSLLGFWGMNEQLR